MSFPRYRNYKSDCVPWLDRVPRHWDILRLGILFKEVAEPGDDHLPLLTVSIHYGVTDKELGDDELDRTVARSDDRTKYKRVKPGDLVYNMMRAWQGAFGTVKVPGMVSPAYVVARPRISICTEFIEHLLRTPQAIEELRRHSHGVTDFRLRLYWDKFKSIRVPIPPQDEQTGILNFLDRETEKIDALILEQRRLVELLAEKRQSVITHIVTRGLNSKAPVKDSEIKSLGAVPKHWEVMPLRRCVLDHRQGYYSESAYVESGVKLLRITDLCELGRIDVTECPRVALREELKPFLLRESDFVFARTGGAGTFGLVEDLTEPVAYASYLIRFRFSPNTHANFLRYFFLSSSFQQAIEQNVHGGVNQNVHAEDIKNQHIALPPVEEQLSIAKFLDAQTAQFHALIVEAERAISLLQERRVALISAAVTGKIDVRRLAAAVPEREAAA